MYDAKVLVTLRGVQFYGEEAKDIFQTLKRGTELRLERNPRNIHDIYAIKVLAKSPWTKEWVHIGHMAHEHARIMEPWLAYFDAKYPLEQKYTAKLYSRRSYSKKLRNYGQFELVFHDLDVMRQITAKGSSLTRGMPFPLQ